MARYLPSQNTFEVLGQSLYSLLSALDQNAWIGRKILAQHGVYQINPRRWYPIELGLEFYRVLSEKLGEHSLLAIGKRIPEHAAWPPDITTIEAGLASIDIAYHLNHRVDGEIMYNPETGVMKEGIGHYSCHVEGKRRIVIVSDSPYPSDVDRGIVLGISRKFRPIVDVTLVDSAPSRKRGGDSCTYLVTW